MTEFLVIYDWLVIGFPHWLHQLRNIFVWLLIGHWLADANRYQLTNLIDWHWLDFPWSIVIDLKCRDYNSILRRFDLVLAYLCHRWWIHAGRREFTATGGRHSHHHWGVDLPRQLDRRQNEWKRWVGSQGHSQNDPESPCVFNTILTFRFIQIPHTLYAGGQLLKNMVHKKKLLF